MIHTINGIPSSKIINTEINPEVHKTKEAQQLKESCQQFESILWAKIWKDMRNTAMSISGNDKNRPYQQIEELSLEMSSEDLVERSEGAGLWKMLYDSMIGKVAADMEATQLREANEEAMNLDVQA